MIRTEFDERAGWRLLIASLVTGAIGFAIASERLRGLLLSSAWLAGGALAISIPAGTLLALAITKTSLPGRRIALRLLIALLLVPLYVQAAAWQAALGHGGWLTTWMSGVALLAGWPAAIWIHGVAAIPWVVLFVSTSLKNTPCELEEEALQDAHRWRVLTSVSLRQAVVGMIAAVLWVTVVCFGEITVTDLFQIRTFAEEVYTAASLGVLNGPQQEAISVDAPQLVSSDLWLGTAVMGSLVSAALAAIWRWLPLGQIVSQKEGWICVLKRERWLLAAAVWILIAVVVAVPSVSLLAKAGTRIERAKGAAIATWSASKAAELVFRSPWEHRRELRWSLTIGGLAAAGATTIGVLLAWALRTRRLPVVPIALLGAIGFSIPGPLLGIWTIEIFNRPEGSHFEFLTWCYDNTLVAPVVVQMFRALPLTTLLLTAQFFSVSQEILDSSIAEGAGWWRRLIEIVLPLRWPGVIAAACVALLVATGDMAATLLVAPPGVSTLSMRIFSLLHYGAEDRVSAICLALGAAVAISSIAVWQLAEIFQRRR